MSDQNSGVISVDIGTGSVRACFYDAKLRNMHQKQLSITLETDITGKAEQSFEEIREAVFRCIGDVIRWTETNKYTPEAICFSNAVSSLVITDSDFHPLRPVLTYADLRAHREADDLKKDVGEATLLQTACPMHASYWLPKLIWLRNEGFDISTSDHICTIKDLIVYELTSDFITDSSNAAAMGLCNAPVRDWDEKLLDMGGVTRDQLPTIMPTTTVLQPVKGRIIEGAQFPKQLKIVLGATDGVLSSLGAGAYKPGQVTTMIGSSGACRIAADTPLVGQNEPITWSYPLDEEIWIRGGAMNSGGLVTDWLVKQFFLRESLTSSQAFEEMLERAQRINAGSDGLIFLPYIFGERAPIWNEHARGVYFGVHGNHHAGHFARATIEGILFALYSIYEVIISDTDIDIEIRATGGYTQSDLMMQTQADIFGVPVGVQKNYEGSSIGAAVLGLKAMGMIKTYDEISAFLNIEKIFTPNPEISSFYNTLFVKFKDIYQQLSPLF